MYIEFSLCVVLVVTLTCLMLVMITCIHRIKLVVLLMLLISGNLQPTELLRRSKWDRKGGQSNNQHLKQTAGRQLPSSKRSTHVRMSHESHALTFMSSSCSWSNWLAEFSCIHYTSLITSSLVSNSGTATVTSSAVTTSSSSSSSSTDSKNH